MQHVSPKRLDLQRLSLKPENYDYYIIIIFTFKSSNLLKYFLKHSEDLKSLCDAHKNVQQERGVMKWRDGQ
jgi:hypothetical protein